MFNSDAFNYINVLNKAADASWMREQVIANNLANSDTPGYKRMDVEFDSILKAELGGSEYTSMDQKVAGIHMSHLQGRTYLDHSAFSYRLDGNNVDPDTENVELASETLKYLGLTDSISQEISRYKMVLK